MMKASALVTAGVVVAALAYTCTASAAQEKATPQVEQRVARLEALIERLEAQLQDVQELVRTMATPSSPVETVRDVQLPSMDQMPLLGRGDSALLMIEFSDFQCPFCKEYVTDTFPRIKSEFVDSGRVRYGFRNMPLESAHREALPAAVVGECARRQGQFWPMHEALFADQEALGSALYLREAQAIGIDRSALDACMNSDVADLIRRQRDESIRIGITSTPTFLIGAVDQRGHMKIGVRIAGAQPFAVFRTVIERVLAAPNG